MVTDLRFNARPPTYNARMNKIVLATPKSRSLSIAFVMENPLASRQTAPHSLRAVRWAAGRHTNNFRGSSPGPVELRDSSERGGDFVNSRGGQECDIPIHLGCGFLFAKVCSGIDREQKNVLEVFEAAAAKHGALGEDFDAHRGDLPGAIEDFDALRTEPGRCVERFGGVIKEATHLLRRLRLSFLGARTKRRTLRRCFREA